MGTTEMGLKREGRRQQQEGFIIQMLRKRGGERVCCCCRTPPPTWRLEASSQAQHHGLNKNPVPEFLLDFPTTKVSARKLCAFLWQIQPHQKAPLRRRRDHKSFEQPASANSLRRQAAALFAQHHIPIEPNSYATQPVTSSNHSNFAEAAQCNCAVIPTSSMEVKGRIRESSCNLKTSGELLRVLNRIQSIREQHASNMSAVKGLKVELDLSRGQIKELKRGKQMNSWQMKSLVKQMADDKFVRKNNAHDRLKVAVQSVEEDLEDERRSRRHSESLYWRPAQELSEVKSLFYGSLRELERERKARILLENLCDEFAIRIRDCEQESCSVKQNSVKNDEAGADGDNHGRLILDISEAWLDERMKMKVTKASDDLLGINSVVDKLGFDIETFLRAKRSVNLRKYENSSPKEVREIHPCQYNSLDSFPLQESISAPVNMHDDDDDAENLGAAFGERHGNISSIDQEKKGSQISTGKQVQSKQIKANTSHDDEERLFMERNSNDRTALINETEISTVCEEPVQVAQESDRSLIKILDSSHRISRSSTNHDRVNLENMRRGDSCVHSVDGSNVSPVNQRKLRFSKGVKEGMLKAKLLEARLDGHYSRFVAGNSSLG